MENKEKSFVSAVVYVHNASGRVGKFIQTLVEVLGNNFEHSEIICVNDASDDGCVDEVRHVGENATGVSVTVLNMSFFHGVELAMSAGVDLAIGDFVFEFDSTVLDFSPSVIMQVYRRSLEGYDIVSASPDIASKLSSRIFYGTFFKYSNISYKLTTERFRVLSRRVINRIGSMNNTVIYRKALYVNSGLKMDNIRYDAISTGEVGVDGAEKAYRTNLAVDSLIVFTDIGYKFSRIMTVLMMVVSLLMAVYTVVIYLSQQPVAGWTTTVLFLSVSFFGLFAILTVIIKYLQLIVDMLYKRKHYSFISIEKLTK